MLSIVSYRSITLLTHEQHLFLICCRPRFSQNHCDYVIRVFFQNLSCNLYFFIYLWCLAFFIKIAFLTLAWARLSKTSWYSYKLKSVWDICKTILNKLLIFIYSDWRLCLNLLSFMCFLYLLQATFWAS